MTIGELVEILEKLEPSQEIEIWGTIDDNGNGFITTKNGVEIKNF